MRIILGLAALVTLAGCAAPAPSAVGQNVTSHQPGVEAARQHCLMMLRPHIPAGTPALESKLMQRPDAPNGDKVLRLPYVYGTTGVRMDARCHYTELADGEWQFSRLTLTPRYPQPKE